MESILSFEIFLNYTFKGQMGHFYLWHVEVRKTTFISGLYKKYIANFRTFSYYKINKSNFKTIMKHLHKTETLSHMETKVM